MSFIRAKIPLVSWFGFFSCYSTVNAVLQIGSHCPQPQNSASGKHLLSQQTYSSNVSEQSVGFLPDNKYLLVTANISYCSNYVVGIIKQKGL